MPLRKLLALDGGGAWSYLQALTLAEVYGADTPGRTILDDFEVAAATSGGSIVLAGLILDRTPREIMALFQSDRHTVFQRPDYPPEIDAAFHEWSTHKKREGLAEVLRGRDGAEAAALPLAELGPRGALRTPRLVIPAYDYDRERVQFFRAGARRPPRGALPALLDGPTLLDAVHATTTAPVTYFDAPAQVARRRFWDGAISSFHNPIVAGVIDMIEQGFPRQDIRVLSIGTGTLRGFSPAQQERLRKAGHGVPDELVAVEQPTTLLRDVSKLATAVLGDPPDAATYVAHRMLQAPPTPEGDGDAEETTAIVRLSPVVRPVQSHTPGLWRAPYLLSALEFRTLLNLDLDAVDDEAFSLVENLGRCWARATAENELPNQGVRQAADLSCTLGHPIFSDAVAAWRASG